MKELLRKSLRELISIRQPLAISNALSSTLAARCEFLQNVPLQDYLIEDLRLLISQQIGLPWLVPLALAQLTLDLFTEGDYYAGDLLASVLRLENDYWQAHPAEWTTFRLALATQLPLAGPHNLPHMVLQAARQRLAHFEGL